MSKNVVFKSVGRKGVSDLRAEYWAKINETLPEDSKLTKVQASAQFDTVIDIVAEAIAGAYEVNIPGLGLFKVGSVQAKGERPNPLYKVLEDGSTAGGKPVIEAKEAYAKPTIKFAPGIKAGVAENAQK